MLAQNSGRESVERQAKIRDADLRPLSPVEKQLGIRRQQVARWDYYLSHKNAYRERLLGAMYKAAALMEPDGTNIRGTQGTGDNEWFTPQEYVERARAVLGEIDLDPATHPAAQERIQAKSFFTQQDDGLKKDWHGRVWLNPPYSQPAISDFISKLIAEIDAGRVTDAILLTHNYTDTAWFHAAAERAHLICFTRGRIRFEAPHGELAAPTQGQAFFYFGKDHRRFGKHFLHVGFMVASFGAFHE